MLVLSRKVNERIVIGDSLVITITAIRGDRVRLGFEGPPELKIHREEVLRKIEAEEAAANEAVACDVTPASRGEDESPERLGELNVDVNPRIPLLASDRFAATDEQPSPLLSTYYCE